MVTEGLDERRRRCLFRATHRGTKEMDWLLGRHAQQQLPAAGPVEMAIWERLVLVPDPLLYDWIVNGLEVGDPEFAAPVDAIRGLHGLTD